jgi:hypothetical protein
MDNEQLLETKSEIVSYVLEKKVWDLKVICSFIFAVIFVGIGFYKIFAYSNSDLGDKVNAYVGGDAYNYIINSNLGIAYFVLALIFVVIGSTFYICNHLKGQR